MDEEVVEVGSDEERFFKDLREEEDEDFGLGFMPFSFRTRATCAFRLASFSLWAEDLFLPSRLACKSEGNEKEKNTV